MHGRDTPTSLDLSAVLDGAVDWRYKSFPPTAEPVAVRAVARQEWRALDGDLLFPVMLLKASALQHNVDLMARYCRENGVSLAPHAKTPLAPQIVQLQLDAGAWGVTVATMHQVRVMRAVGVRRLLLANELVEGPAVRWVVSEMARHPDFEFLCLVDSLDAVAILSRQLAHGNPERPLRVLVEVGVAGGRSGVRDRTEAAAVAEAVKGCPLLELAGVEGYEGAVPADESRSRVDAVDSFLRRLRVCTDDLAREGMFRGLDEIIVSAGGSIFFDRVVAHLAGPWDLDMPVRVVLRAGSYVTHDFDLQERLSPLAGRGSGEERLRPALELWAVVLSRPEPDLAILGFGKRDAPYDLRLPVAFAVWRDRGVQPLPAALEVTALNDQHAYLRVQPESDLAAGDVLGLNIAHPCTSFDKWRLVPVVDDAYQVIDAIQTFF